MFQEMLAAGSGGGGGVANFKVLQEFLYYSTSATLTIPNGTDFIIAISSAWNTENSQTGDLSSIDITSVLTKVGDSVTTTQATKNGTTSYCTVTLTWSTQTTVTLTRSSTAADTRIYACQYV